MLLPSFPLSVPTSVVPLLAPPPPQLIVAAAATGATTCKGATGKLDVGVGELDFLRCPSWLCIPVRLFIPLEREAVDAAGDVLGTRRVKLGGAAADVVPGLTDASADLEPRLAVESPAPGRFDPESRSEFDEDEHCC